MVGNVASDLVESRKYFTLPFNIFDVVDLPSTNICNKACKKIVSQSMNEGQKPSNIINEIVRIL